MIKQTQGRNEMNAHKTYNERRAAMMDKLEELYHLIEVTDVKESANPNNWGYAGSLGHVNEELDNLIKFMGGK
jgi:hypothetical protein